MMPFPVETKDVQAKANFATVLISRGDIVLDNGGKLVFISWLDKLGQNIQRELSILYSSETNQGNEAFATLETVTARNDYALNLLRNNFLSALIRLQARQSSSTPPAEVLTRIVTVIAAFDEIDPTTVIVGVAVLNALKQSVEATYAVNSDTLSVKLVN